MKTRVTLSFAVLLTLVFLLTGFTVSAQEQTEDILEEDVLEAAPTEQIEPVFPVENENVIFIEGEDAVSTNFNKEPILNYSCSGSRTLQLNRTKGQQGGAAFYANYAFYLEQGGSYELWYGGTPAGPADELLPSYSSPFLYSLDEGEPQSVYREDMSVVEQYAPSYYWCYIGDLDLGAGQHVIDFSVTEKRRFDDKYYFYLDTFFLVRKKDGRRVTSGPLPEVFPKNMDDRSIDFPFRSIEDYQIIIREDPKNLTPYIELALFYTLVGDNLNAIKYLKRAVLIDPKNLNSVLLMAKNLIWKGDVTAGLETYRELLLKAPERLDTWIEAGKVAAWTGRYEESISFFESGLGQFPDELSLLVNLGLTQLWSGETKMAQETLLQAEEVAGADYAKLKDLAQVYRINGYPVLAINLYKKMTRDFPEQLETYLLLEETYSRTGRREEAQKIRVRIQERFIPSDRLTAYLDLFDKKQGSKDAIINRYEEQLAQQPNDLALRETLAQTYFWNGEDEKGIQEYMNILVNHAFQSLNDMDSDSLALLQLMDNNHLYFEFFKSVPTVVAEKEKEFAGQLKAYQDAEKAYQSLVEKQKAAREKGEEPPQPEGEDPQDTLKAAEDALAASLSWGKRYLDLYQDQIRAFEGQNSELETLQAAEAEQQDVFHNITKVIHWQWDRRGFVEELQSVGGSGQVLADYVLGKIRLVEDNLPGAETLLTRAVESGVTTPQYSFGLIEALLWQGKVPEALALLQSREEELNELYPYLEELQKQVQAVQIESGTVTAIGGVKSDEVQLLLGELGALKKDSAQHHQAVENTLDQLHALLEAKMIRSFYFFQENTFLLRNELGNFYLQREKLDLAIRQFQEVLAIDPWDIDAVYRLGQVFEWKGNWHQALKNYERVFYSDPLYENVTGKYNALARRHADSLRFASSTQLDSNMVQIRAQADVIYLINSMLGLGGGYALDSVRKEADPAKSYFLQSVYLSLPLDLYTLDLTLTPKVGVVLANTKKRGNFAFNEKNFGASELFGIDQTDPLFGLDLTLGLGDYVFLNGGYVFLRHPETYDDPRSDRVYSHSGELALNTSLSFVQAPVLRDSSLRTYGEVEVLLDQDRAYSNYVLTAAQELYLGLLTIDEPWISLQLLGNFVYQNSDQKEEIYYTPIDTWLGGFGLLFNSWLPVGEENGLGLNFKTAGSFYHDDSDQRVQLDLEAGVEYFRGEAVYYLSTAFASTHPYRWKQNPFKVSTWDYWSLAIRLGFSTSLPRLLVP